MREVVLSLLLIPSLILISFGLNDHKKQISNEIFPIQQRVIHYQIVDETKYNTHLRSGVGDNYDFEFAVKSNKTAIYASGLWLGHISGNDTLHAIAECAYDYLFVHPAITENFRSRGSPVYRIYKFTPGGLGNIEYIQNNKNSEPERIGL